MHRLVALARGYLPAVGLLLLPLGLLAVVAVDDLGPFRLPAVAAVVLGALAVGLGTLAGGVAGAPSPPARTIASPVAGRWRCLNSPTTRVPSHGTHGLGQSHAVDVLLDPLDGHRPAFGEGSGFRPPQDFPAFGAPVTSPVAGRVVAARDGARDHRSRTSWPAVAYLLAEGVVRDLAGPRRLLGNHVVVELEPGCVAVLAHLQRGSVAVRPGDTVAAGDLLGRCGNSGNTSEPHVHLQLSTSARLRTADGLAFALDGTRTDDGTALVELPGNDEVFVTGP